MQSVEDAFSVEEISPTRSIAHSLLSSWKKEYSASLGIFTIGTSTIGGMDVITPSDNVVLSWQRYSYVDESPYVMDINYERHLNVPLGGAAHALADFTLDNTSGRFLPDYLGGNSELFTAVLPRRPIIINAGFHYGGVDHLLRQFIGMTTKTPNIDQRARTAQFEAADFMNFLSNKYIDETAMYTGVRSDVLIENVLTTLGYQTADYDLDVGSNTINFSLFPTGSTFGDVLNSIVQAEAGHLYQDENGKIIFRNHNTWELSPWNDVQRIITTAQVLNYGTDPVDNIINVVEVRASPRVKAASQTIYTLATTIELPVGDTEVFVEFDDPVLFAGIPSYTANDAADGSGANRTANVSIHSTSVFAQSAKYVFSNNYSGTVYLTTMTITGRPALVDYELYYRTQDDSSVTAYEEHPLLIENDYVQDAGWAEQLAAVVLGDFAEPDNFAHLTIRAMPELQLGDLVSWQGRQWRLYNISTRIDPAYGFVQDIDMLYKTSAEYFQIGASLIGGSAPLRP